MRVHKWYNGNAFNLPEKKNRLNKSETYMVQKGLMTRSGRGYTRTVKLVLDDVDYIAKFKEIFGASTINRYLDMSQNGRIMESERKINRRKRFSEALVMMYRIGVTVFASDKYYRAENQIRPGQDAYNSRIPHFYSMREIKELTQDIYRGHTRLFGVLFSSGGVYCVYNYGKNHYAWNNQGETAISRQLFFSLRRFYPKTFNGLDWRELQIRNAIVFGVDMTIALKYCLDPFANRKYKSADKKAEFELPSVNNRVYKKMHYIPLTFDGMFALSKVPPIVKTRISD